MDELGEKQRVLYITYDGLTDALGQSQILSYLVPLSKQGYEFHVLSFEKEANFRKNEAIVSRKVAEAGLHWVKQWYTKKPPVLSTLYDIYRAVTIAEKLHREVGFDVVHCRGYVPALVGLHLKKKYGIQFIFDMRGWWADEKVESGAWAKPLFRPVYRYFKQKEKEFFTCADFNVSLTEVGQEEITNKFGIPRKKTGVVPTCVNFEVFRERSDKKSQVLRKELGIGSDDRVLVYSGALGGNYDLNILLSVFRAFNSSFPQTHLLILSKDELPPPFQSELERAGITNYTLRNVPYSQVSDYLCIADVGLIFYKSAFSNIGRSPTKLGEYWASGIPVIANRGIGDLALLEQRFPGGIVLFTEAENDLEQKLYSLKFNQHHLLRTYAEDYCSLEKGVSFYRSVYRQLIHTIKLHTS